MHSVLEMPPFTRRADTLLTRDERDSLVNFLAFNPMAGDVIPETGGVRKVRWAPKGRGKRGAFRVIYYVLTDALPIYLILIYGKNEQADLTPDQRRAAARLVQSIKETR